MTFIHTPKPWQLKEKDATPESTFHNRREIIKALGLTGLGAGVLLTGCNSSSEQTLRAEELANDPTEGSAAKATDELIKKFKAQSGYIESMAEEMSPLAELTQPFSPNTKYQVPERGLTKYSLASSYNNFYEFTLDKGRVKKLSQKLVTNPWEVEIGGLVEKPMKIDLNDLMKNFELEERIYRFRCVEAWSMTVPWIGFPMAKFVEYCKPTAKAKYVRFVTAEQRDTMPNLKNRNYPWPYYEGLRLDEAMNELSLMTVGLYGKVLPKQNGAPLRVIVPWKYGYKSIKSIVKVEFTSKQPKTFWNDLAPFEYGFLSNVDPKVPHPRWSQARERLIDNGKRIKTMKFNGYGEFVAGLYS